jgi:RNA polymerase sigma-70 factor (ECF subfamily)
MAQFAIGNADHALDIVQDAMLDFVRRYRDKPQPEWTPLFFKVVQSRITDAHRRQSVRSRIWSWFGRDSQDTGDVDLIQEAQDPNGINPLLQLERSSLDSALKKAIRSLPLRQQQAFLLRTWEGLDIAETALAMGCSDGSVKTHYFRAVQALRKQLEEFEP